MQARRYLLLDVFAGKPLEGNPLAVVLDAEGLDTARMQAITREFNLSETVFVRPPDDPAHAARIRIFCPDYEMPFAGHPTVGSAVALWRERGDGDGAVLVLEENIGPVRCTVTGDEASAFAEFVVPRLASTIDAAPAEAEIAAALGLDPSEIGLAGHAVGAWTAGVPYVTVPVKGLAAIRRIGFDPHRWRPVAPDQAGGQKASAYVYCRETEGPDCSYHARMFTPAGNGWEDPATGSAAAAFVGAFVACERPADGSHDVWIEQGIEMGRPSRIRLQVDVENGRATAARIGGEAVIVGRGEIYV
jgi:trans-2,3-dihydro-3-hydroxyanthranilate isomerase